MKIRDSKSMLVEDKLVAAHLIECLVLVLIII